MEPQIKQRYIDTGKVRFEWRNLAWIGDESRRAAAASACAHEQGKFWVYHEKLYHSQKGYNRGTFSAEFLTDLARQTGLDTDQFTTCLTENRYAEAVAAEYKAGRDLGVTGTPTFFVNGKKEVGLQRFDKWVEIIEAALKEKGS